MFTGDSRVHSWVTGAERKGLSFDSDGPDYLVNDRMDTNRAESRVIGLESLRMPMPLAASPITQLPTKGQSPEKDGKKCQRCRMAVPLYGPASCRNRPLAMCISTFAP